MSSSSPILETVRRLGVHFDAQVVADESRLQVSVRRGPALNGYPVDFGYYVKGGLKNVNVTGSACDGYAVVEIRGLSRDVPVVVKAVIKHKRKKPLRARVALVRENGNVVVQVLVPKRTHCDVITQKTTIKRAQVPVVVHGVPAGFAEAFGALEGVIFDGTQAGTRHAHPGSNGAAPHAGNGQSTGKKKVRKDRDARRKAMHS